MMHRLNQEKYAPKTWREKAFLLEHKNRNRLYGRTVAFMTFLVIGALCNYAGLHQASKEKLPQPSTPIKTAHISSSDLNKLAGFSYLASMPFLAGAIVSQKRMRRALQSKRLFSREKS